MPRKFKIIVFIAIFMAIQFKVLSWAMQSEKKPNERKQMSVNELLQNPLESNSANKMMPLLLEHYTGDGVQSGLVPTATGFVLNGKKLKIISGAVHYFRIHPSLWRDRLRKVRAAGLTVVETYVPWNLHEPRKGVFDFGEGNNDMSMFLDIASYIRTAQEEDLLVILRPGPYICSEWDFGGLPSWLLRDPTMQVRTSYGPYLERTDRFLEKLIPIVKDLQFTSNGPIIAVQVENEYGAFGYEDHPRDKNYLKHLTNKMKGLGIKEMLFTSDSPAMTLDWGSVSGVLQTANFIKGAAKEFRALKQFQPDMPLMVTEFWSGWFDHWTQGFHYVLKPSEFEASLKEIFSFGASVSFYMFHGGTNFGFLNGANVVNEFPNYLPDITSYDYDAPLSEAGDYTEKYELISKLVGNQLAVQTRLPQRPPQSLKKSYPTVVIDSYITFNDLIDQVPQDMVVVSNSTLSMEELPINDMNGQSYGFVVYRKTIPLGGASVLKVRGHVRDFAQVLINGELQTPPIKTSKDLYDFGSWFPRDASFNLGSWRPLPTNQADGVMDIVVENMGRINYGKPHDFVQKKGLWEGPVLLDERELFDWKIIPLELKGNWVRELKSWRPFNERPSNLLGPVVVRATLNIQDSAADTFIDMSKWGKGVVFINGFNLGRYWSSVGPQQTFYLPAPLLKVGENTIVIYEQYYPSMEITFTDTPKLGHTTKSIY